MTGLGSITQLGYVTNDLEASVKSWVNVMGVGPFTKMTGVVMPAIMEGEAVEIKIDLALSYKDGVQIELIQPLCESSSPYKMNKEAKIWGSHHTQFTVKDLDEAIKTCQSEGMELACEITSAGSRYIYMRSNTGWIELTTPPLALAPFFDSIKESCEQWDGHTLWNA